MPGSCAVDIFRQTDHAQNHARNSGRLRWLPRDGYGQGGRPFRCNPWPPAPPPRLTLLSICLLLRRSTESDEGDATKSPRRQDLPVPRADEAPIRSRAAPEEIARWLDGSMARVRTRGSIGVQHRGLASATATPGAEPTVAPACCTALKTVTCTHAVSSRRPSDPVNTNLSSSAGRWNIAPSVVARHARPYRPPLLAPLRPAPAPAPSREQRLASACASHEARPRSTAYRTGALPSCCPWRRPWLSGAVFSSSQQGPFNHSSPEIFLEADRWCTSPIEMNSTAIKVKSINTCGVSCVLQ